MLVRLHGGVPAALSEVKHGHREAEFKETRLYFLNFHTTDSLHNLQGKVFFKSCIWYEMVSLHHRHSQFDLVIPPSKNRWQPFFFSPPHLRSHPETSTCCEVGVREASLFANCRRNGVNWSVGESNKELIAGGAERAPAWSRSEAQEKRARIRGGGWRKTCYR